MTPAPLSIQEYFDRLCGILHPLAADIAPVSAGRVLAEPVSARAAIPPRDNSAMDGFLTPPLDGPCTLKVIGDVPAGSPARTPCPDTAVRIMTGAAVPTGFNGMVVPVENTDVSPGPGPLPATVTIRTLPARDHIRRRGSHVVPGQQLAESATLVDASLLATLLSAGVDTAPQHRIPRVTVIATGEELVSGQLPDSNGPMLEALVSATGPAHITRLCCGDDPAELARVLDDAVTTADSDLIVTSGGVSAGAFDVVHTVLSQRGERAWFGHVAQRPGAPQGHALWQDVPVLCLPGNPVAAFVSAHLYLTPALRILRGLPRPTSVVDRPALRAIAGADFPASPTPLIQPCVLDLAGTVTASPPPGPRMRSHHVGALPGTGGFAVITDPVAAGQTLTIYPY
ncbi:molybdopterin molybdotransferase MoeA [uncultured Corynebacterium sp.]|uniref:molybdopterin molybdotransferase MoeA n=1 Tax=uncultured Corynebacterium sp. TaxID=159447 RepID=UPI0025FB8ECE|nr:molybdopterin molybdotransferase MoeA [uncultured Corynebacterium sp.]